MFSYLLKSRFLDPIRRFFHVSPSHILSSLLSITVLALALFMLWLGHFLPESLPDKIDVREIAVTMPPPPPPAPPVQQNVVETTLSVAIEGSGPVIPKMDIKPTLEPIKPDVPTIDSQPTQWQALTVDWEVFDLAQLDDFPTLLTPLRVKLPKSLSRQGIKRVLVKLDIMIDTDGQITLVDIVENPHPELINEIQRLVRSSRFTSPSKDNEAVRARFIWPVEIKS